MPRSKVAAVRVTAATVLDDIQRACDLAEMSAALARGASTLVRSTVQQLPVPGTGTTPWQLEGAARALMHAQLNDFVVFQDRIFDADNGACLALCRRLRAPVRSFHDRLDTQRVAFRPKTKLRILHHLFPAGLAVPAACPGTNVLHLPALQFHPYATVAGAAHSALGSLLGGRSQLAPGSLHEGLVDALALQREIHAGSFTIMDGTSIRSATTAEPKRAPLLKSIVLASADPVAIDAVAAKLLGTEPLDVPYIKLAHQDGLGVGDSRDIELVGDDVSDEAWSFSVQPRARSPIGNALRRGQQLLLRTALADSIALGKSLIRDHYRWPRHERAVFETWKRETDWGRLFASYQQSAG